MQTCDAPENHAYLLGRFLARLSSEQPSDVLDVGCGAGALLRACSERGIRAVGVESSEERLAALAAEGLAAERASATALPFEDGAFEWVTMRHVPHHLTDPAAALREAARVARRGLLIAEPWFDVSLASQRLALDHDRWLKSLHRRSGMVHEECLDAEALLAALPEQARDRVELETVLRLRERDPRSWRVEAAAYLSELDPEGADLQALGELEARAVRDGLSWNGSLLLVARLA